MGDAPAVNVSLGIDARSNGKVTQEYERLPNLRG